MKDIDKILKAVENYPSHYQPNVEEGINRFKQRIEAEQSGKLRLVSRNFMAIAASISILIIFSIGWQSYGYQGKGIVLTEAGDKTSVELPDGTLVHLNENSSLKYDWSERFASDRMIVLSGEAYFEVRKQKNRPFQITTPNSKVSVLGTSFNLKDYPKDKLAKIEVTEGQVAFSGLNQKDLAVQLAVNEIGTYNPAVSAKPEVISSNNLNGNSWLTDKLSFKDASVTKVIEDLENHFNVIISCENPTLKARTFTGNFQNKTLREIFNSLETGLQIQIFSTSIKNHYRFQMRPAIQ